MTVREKLTDLGVVDTLEQMGAERGFVVPLTDEQLKFMATEEAFFSLIATPDDSAELVEAARYSLKLLRAVR